MQGFCYCSPGALGPLFFLLGVGGLGVLVWLTGMLFPLPCGEASGEEAPVGMKVAVLEDREREGCSVLLAGIPNMEKSKKK